MQSRISKIAIASLIILVFLLHSPRLSFANAPDISGGVTSRTGAPIVGATVVWKDNRGATRTATTDGNGRFFFVSWQNSGRGSGFGCLESPHTWSVPSLNCTPITRSFSNTGASLDIGNIDCVPPQPPPPTLTPTPTPTPLPYCGGPCNYATTNCPLDCPLCAAGPSGTGICGGHPGFISPTSSPAANNPNINRLNSNSNNTSVNFILPTMSFMQLKLGQMLNNK